MQQRSRSNTTRCLQQGPAVLAMYPEYVDDANAYELMADADKAKGDAKAEAAILTAYEHDGGQIAGRAASVWRRCRRPPDSKTEADGNARAAQLHLPRQG